MKNPFKGKHPARIAASVFLIVFGLFGMTQGSVGDVLLGLVIVALGVLLLMKKSKTKEKSPRENKPDSSPQVAASKPALAPVSKPTPAPVSKPTPAPESQFLNAEKAEKIWQDKWGGVAGGEVEKRIERALRQQFTVIEFNEKKMYARFAATQGDGRYYTTLAECSCPDFKKRGVPCKHMYYVAMKCGVHNL